MEEDVDPDTLRQFKLLEDRDRRRWTVADRDKNLQLTKEEFKGFIHPEYYEHMYSVNRDETMADLDLVSMSQYDHCSNPDLLRTLTGSCLCLSSSNISTATPRDWTWRTGTAPAFSSGSSGTTTRTASLTRMN